MKISEKLYQFTEAQAFLIVTGMHAGALYRAHQGEVEKLESFEVPVPKYSDREGFYARGGKGGTFVSGAVREVGKTDIQKQFIKDMSARAVKAIAPFARKFDIAVYLYAPKELLPHLEGALPVSVNRYIKDRFLGNHLHLSPLDLIGMLKKRKDEGVESLKQALAKPEVKKLLKKRPM